MGKEGSGGYTPVEIINQKPDLQKIPYQNQFASFEITQEESSTDRQFDNNKELLEMHLTNADSFPSMVNLPEKKSYIQKNGFYERYKGYVEERFSELMQVSSEKVASITSSSTKHEQQIAEINALREEFYRAVPDARPKPEEGEREDRGYDIVFDKWLRNKTPEEGLEKYQEYLEVQNRTYFGEESGVYARTSTYTLGKDGFIYMNELSKETSFEEIVALGVAVAMKENSPDLPEELLELKGIIQMSEFANLAEDGETYVMISEPGESEDSRYKKNFVDIGRKVVDPKTGAISLKVTRFKSSHTPEEYASLSVRENPEFFKGFDFENSSVRGWHLSHFIFPEIDSKKVSAHDLFSQWFTKHPEAISEEEFLREIYVTCFPYVKAYIHLASEQASWKELAQAHHSLLACFQTIMDKRKEGKIISINNHIDVSNNNWQKTVAMASASQRASFLGVAIKSVGGACGSRRGYGNFGDNIESLTTTALLDSFSLDSLVASGMETLELITKGCKGCIKEGNPDNHYHCPDCNKKYPDQTDTKRTAICGEDGTGGCGFVFDGCGATQEEVPTPQIPVQQKRAEVIVQEDNVIVVNFGNKREENNQEEVEEEPVKEVVVYQNAA